MVSVASLLIAALFKVALPLIALIALIDLATMSRPRRVRLLRRQGMTWAAIAARFSVSPSTVRRWSFA
jgi:DNA invertase Pin-like site-specific DNA recombinase